MAVAQKYEIGSGNEFPEGVIVGKNIGGQDVIFIRRLGKVQCYIDQCTHQPVKLSRCGEAAAGKLVCQVHGGTFDLDRSGAVLVDPPMDALKSFVCEEAAGQVAVYL